MFRVPINADGTAGTPVLQTILDANGNVLLALGVDGFAYADDGAMIGASFDFEAFQSQIVKAIPIDDDTLQTEIIYTGAIGATGVDVEDGTIYIVDGQIVQGLFIEDYAPITPFQTLRRHWPLRRCGTWTLGSAMGTATTGPSRRNVIRLRGSPLL